MNTALYALGFALVLGGLIYAATLMGIPLRWIVAGSLVIVGMAVLKAVKRGRTQDLG